MNRKGLAEAAATQAGLSVAAADAVLSAALEAIVAEVAAGGSVVLPGFGTFEARDRAARQGRNPQTGEPMQIAASRVPAFKAGQAFRRATSA